MAYSKTKRRVVFTVIIVLLILVVPASRLVRRQFLTFDWKTTNVKINGQIIKAEVASDAASEYRGLSFRPSLCADCGMLFLFPGEEPLEFVMRQMKFPLDIIFISRHKIINMAVDLPPEGASPKNIYASVAPADAVLEVNGHYTTKQGIKIGDYVEY